MSDRQDRFIPNRKGRSGMSDATTSGWTPAHDAVSESAYLAQLHRMREHGAHQGADPGGWINSDTVFTPDELRRAQATIQRELTGNPEASDRENLQRLGAVLAAALVDAPDLHTHGVVSNLGADNAARLSALQATTTSYHRVASSDPPVQPPAAARSVEH
jgi:hypothetical protein